MPATAQTCWNPQRAAAAGYNRLICSNRKMPTENKKRKPNSGSCVTKGPLLASAGPPQGADHAVRNNMPRQAATRSRPRPCAKWTHQTVVLDVVDGAKVIKNGGNLFISAA